MTRIHTTVICLVEINREKIYSKTISSEWICLQIWRHFRNNSQIFCIQIFYNLSQENVGKASRVHVLTIKPQGCLCGCGQGVEVRRLAHPLTGLGEGSSIKSGYNCGLSRTQLECILLAENVLQIRQTTWKFRNILLHTMYIILIPISLYKYICLKCQMFYSFSTTIN